MSECPVHRVVKILVGLRADLEAHAAACGDRVTGIALHPEDHRELCIAEVWGLPVLAWTEVERGNYRFLCEANGVLIPNVETVDELLERWAYDLQRAD
jgi:hypothetical protein